jgi:hypothetical protein
MQNYCKDIHFHTDGMISCMIYRHRKRTACAGYRGIFILGTFKPIFWKLIIFDTFYCRNCTVSTGDCAYLRGWVYFREIMGFVDWVDSGIWVGFYRSNNWISYINAARTLCVSVMNHA